MKNVVVVLVDCLRHDAALLHMRELLGNATVWHKCWATAGATVPGAASVWTGRYPHEHGQIAPHLKPHVPSVLEHAERLGYHTLGVSENPLIDWLGVNLPTYSGGLPANEPGAGVQYIAEHLPAEPFFIAYHNMRVHEPYPSHPDGGDFPILNRVGVRPPEELLDSLWAAYHLAVKQTVEQICDLREVVGSDTVFIVTADHGQGFWEHGFVGHIANQLVPELLHVPLVLLNANGEGRRDIQQVVDTTIVQSLALATGSGQGQIKSFDGAMAEDFQYPVPVRAVRQGDWAVKYYADEAGYYDLRRDPGMMKQHNPPGYIRDILGYDPPPALSIRPADNEDDQVVLQRLRSLGYVE